MKTVRLRARTAPTPRQLAGLRRSVGAWLEREPDVYTAGTGPVGERGKEEARLVGARLEVVLEFDGDPDARTIARDVTELYANEPGHDWLEPRPLIPF